MVFMYYNVHVKSMQYEWIGFDMYIFFLLYVLIIDIFVSYGLKVHLYPLHIFFCVFLFVFNIIKKNGESKIELSRMYICEMPAVDRAFICDFTLYCNFCLYLLIHWFTYSLYTCNTSLPMYMFNLIVSNLWNVRIQISTQFHKFLGCFIMKVFYLYISVYIFLDATWSRIPSQPRNFFFYQ